jgi:hypothetical protein
LEAHAYSLASDLVLTSEYIGRSALGVLRASRPRIGALSAWNYRAWLPNNAAIAADTSSPAAATIPVVGTAAAALAARIAESIPIKPVDATAKASGAAITNDDIGLPSVDGDVR